MTQAEWKSKAGGGYNDRGLMFATKSGLPIDQRNLPHMNFARLSKSKVVEGAFERETAEALARDVLSNPVIEDYRVEVEG